MTSLASGPSTRLSDNLFLLGVRDLEPLSRLNQLPTTRQVLLRFHYYLQKTKSIRNASYATIDELSVLWSKASIPTRLTKHSVEKIEKVHSTWLLIKKNKSRTSQSQMDREHGFVAELDSLFDIAHADVLSLIKIDQDHQFLADQRGERKMVMTSVDKELEKQQERTLKRKREEEARRRKAAEIDSSISKPSTSCCGITPEKEESSVSSNENEEEYQPSTFLKKKCDFTGERNKLEPYRKCLFTPQVASALDRNKVSDREAMRIIVPIASALGHDPTDLSISRSTIQRERKKARKEFAEGLKETFKPCDPLVVHWDGKILPEMVGSKTVDRLPVLVSGGGQEKLLGVPKLPSGTGENIAESVHNVLQQWNITEKVQGMCFDTTAANTGNIKGACVLLEKKLGRELMWLACRHHVMELILSKIFSMCIGPSNSPDIPLFKRFKAVWDSIERNNFKLMETDSEILLHFKQNTLEYLSEVENWKSQPRDDYKELIELALTILGKPPSVIHWRAPGPVHHARWMAKMIYAMKMYLFRNERKVFKLTQREEAQLKRLVTFGATLYTCAWIQAPLASEAPANDLKLWQDLKQYETVDEEISKASRKVMQRHLWYLSDELVGLALFSKRVSDLDKKEIVKNMYDVESRKRVVRGSSKKLEDTDDLKLGRFASSRSKKLFTRLEINTSFFCVEPHKWQDNEDYLNGKDKVKNLLVVNDTAERGVKLFGDYNKLLTRNEEEKQYVLQVVEANRKAVPTNPTKKSSLDALQN